MIGRNGLTGLCLLCALAFTAFAAQGASAAIKGTTAFTCIKGGSDGPTKYLTEHCKPGDPSGEYGHKKIAQDTTTDITVTNAKTDAETVGSTVTKLHVDILGFKAELTAATVHGEGTLANKLDPETGEHYIHGTITLKYENVTFDNPIACSVEGGTVTTKPLTFTTTGTGDNVKFTPKEGTTFAEFNAVGAECPEAIKGNYKVTGSVQGQPEGATINFNTAKTTEEGTLKTRNIKSGIDGKITVKGTDTSVPDTVFTPISVTTIETP